MATYVVLISWTDQGVTNFRGTLERAEQAASAWEQLGGKMRDIYWTLGPYDIVSVIEAPDDETMTAMALATASQGNVRTTTLRAFNRDEMAAIIGKLPA